MREIDYYTLEKQEVISAGMREDRRGIVFDLTIFLDIASENFKWWKWWILNSTASFSTSWLAEVR